MKNKNYGFTLVEMIVALVLSTVVLVGLIDVSGSMIRQHFEGIRHGKVDSQTLYALDQMDSEIESSSYLQGLWTAPPSNAILGCVNYDATLGGAIEQNFPVTWFAYCVQNCSSPNGPCDLARYSGSTCPLSTVCGGGTGNTVIYQNFYIEPGYPNPFVLDRALGGVDLHFDVGNPQSTAMQKEPTFYQIDTTLSLNRGTGD